MLIVFAGWYARHWGWFALGLLGIAAAVGIPLWQRYAEEERLARAGLPEIDRMSGEEFERWLARFRRAGVPGPPHALRG